MFNQPKYSVLDKVDYDLISFPQKKKEACSIHNKCFFCDNSCSSNKQKHTPSSLVVQTARLICNQTPAYITEIILNYLPCVLAPILLREAILQRRDTITQTLLTLWPLETLCFMDIIADQLDLFNEQMQFDLAIFKGVIGRTKHCKMKLMDFRGFQLNSTFTRLITEMWPLLSLKKYHNNINKLTDVICQEIGIMDKKDVTYELIKRELQNAQNITMKKHPNFVIEIPNDITMSVLLDTAEFSSENKFFLDYVITSGLRSICGLHVSISNIIISRLPIGFNSMSVYNLDVSPSVTPFLVFCAQNPMSISGICLDGLEGDVFEASCNILLRYKKLTRLSLQDCKLHLKAGKTRSCTQTRIKLCSFLASFPFLYRLDLSENSLAGCMSEILSAITRPLQYLALKKTDLLDCDIEALLQSKHATSLCELDLSLVCGLFRDDKFAVKPESLIRGITDDRLESLTVLTISRNNLTDDHIAILCKAIGNGCWPKLRSLSISDNLITTDGVLSLVRMCCSSNTVPAMPSLQFLHVPFTYPLWDAAEEARHSFAMGISEVLKKWKRDDIMVYVTTSHMIHY